MKKIVFLIVILFALNINAQITKDEYNQLNKEQKSIYDRQQKDINKRRDYVNFRADDQQKMSREMKGDNARAAGAAHSIRAEYVRDRENKKLDKEQERLDKAAREGLKNNKNK